MKAPGGLPVFTRSRRRRCLAALVFAGWVAHAAQPLPPQATLEVRRYIKQGWATLSRSLRDLPAAARDPKLKAHRGPWPVYVGAREDRVRVQAELQKQLASSDLAQVELRVLPADPLRLAEHGLLYLPRPYVVPGGRFNEMYGWDSYFIQLGLLRDGELQRARDMIENFLYEVEHYGMVLNANRTYFLSRSQPPFLTQMILGVFRETRDVTWLRSALPAVEKYHSFWTSPPHMIPAGGLSRYYDLGEGPAPEVVSDEVDEQGRTHYDRVREYYKTHEITDYDVSLYYDRRRDRLTDLFYKGDRSMRESGFDPSDRFGPFSADIIHYAPVCLNTLLYQMELDAAEICATLNQAGAAERWRQRAGRRRRSINQRLWDDRAGLYLDYNFKTGRRRPYPFATTFYPLWAGIASREQAAKVVGNLPLFEAKGGLLTSARTSGNQWDAPFGWAPLQILAVQGLRRYGYKDDADRLARKFLALVVKEFEEHGGILEKYDVRRNESDVSADIRFGYSSNEIGFGWTNAAFLELLAGLERTAGLEPKAARRAAQAVADVAPRP